MKEFQFIYKLSDKGWEYCNFVQLVDRPIRQQKKEVFELLRKGVANKLLSIEKINISLLERVSDTIVVIFKINENLNYIEECQAVHI